jgi:hypothetical protein
MDTPSPRHTTIVAVTSQDDAHASVRQRAAGVARDAGSTVILWAIDASVSPLESPLPTDWSGDGEQQQFGDRLGPDDLAAAGREALGRQVGELRSAGIDAWGWLPDTADAEHLASYASEQGATLILVSTADTDLLADLRAADGHDEGGHDGTRRGPTIEAVPG